MRLRLPPPCPHSAAAAAAAAAAASTAAAVLAQREAVAEVQLRQFRQLAADLDTAVDGVQRGLVLLP
jgi:hypothetical protein